MPSPSRATAPSPETSGILCSRGSRPLAGGGLIASRGRPRHRRTEHTVPLDLVMDRLQPSAVAVDGEVRHGPDDLAQEEDHGADVEELELEAFVAALHDLQARRPGLIGLDLVVAAVASVERSQEVLADLDVGAAADVLREVDAPGCEHPAISDQWTVAGWRLVTRSNAPSAKGNGGSWSSATTTAPSGWSSAVALARLGGHPSVATNVGGKLSAPTPASTSPPPVWMSSAAVAAASLREGGVDSPMTAAARWRGRRARRSPSPRRGPRRPRPPARRTTPLRHQSVTPSNAGG